MRTNAAAKDTKPAPKTAEGAPAARINASQALRRSVLSCFLWEKEFYEEGEAIADRIMELAKAAPASEVAALAVEARNIHNLRHVPLLLTVALAAKGGTIVGETIAAVVQRADELSELVAMYWKINGKDKPLSAQMKKGLAAAFTKFDEYQLAKYDRATEVRLRDVMFLVHPKAKDAEQDAVFKRLAANELTTPDTWEVALSGGADKKETFTRLIKEGKLGYLALLRNLRNMEQAGVDEQIVKAAIAARKGADRVLPFRFFAAAKSAPRFEAELDTAMSAEIAKKPKLPGKTVIIVDVSGSMGSSLSARSEMSRMDAASALAAVIREQCEDVVVYATAGNDSVRVHKTALVPPRRGMALAGAIVETRRVVGGGGIFLTPVMDFVADKEKNVDRCIVITDEQDCGTGPGQAPSLAKLFAKTNYMLNVSGHKNGIGYGKWVHIDGFSEAVARFIMEYEGWGGGN